MKYFPNAEDLILSRNSCRTYDTTPLSDNDISTLQEFIDQSLNSPFSNKLRYKIVSPDGSDSQMLRGLGTYGFIKNPAGFLIGAIENRDRDMEDFGFITEVIILKATELGIGTCWLGGTFTKSRFSKIMDISSDESIPCVISLGYPADHKAWIDRTSRIYAGADRRLPWNELFFKDSFHTPLIVSSDNPYRKPLELVRLAPSASNKQPWRILNQGNLWHFYLRRTKNYPSPLFNFIVGLADLQRVDMGIALAHFELSAQQLGFDGKWINENPNLPDINPELEYNITWESVS